MRTACSNCGRNITQTVLVMSARKSRNCSRISRGCRVAGNGVDYMYQETLGISGSLLGRACTQTPINVLMLRSYSGTTNGWEALEALVTQLLAIDSTSVNDH